MAWVGLIKSRQKRLALRIEDAGPPGWCARLYDGEEMVGEQAADSPRQAIGGAIELARRYLNDDSITVSNVDWVQR